MEKRTRFEMLIQERAQNVESEAYRCALRDSLVDYYRAHGMRRRAAVARAKRVFLADQMRGRAA